MPTSAQPTVLTIEQAQAYYDGFGRKQDGQDFYEGPALDDLIAHADFAHAEHVFEFGCGTGQFAARVLADTLPACAEYVGCDLSPVMVGLATERVAAFGARARVSRTDGAIHFPVDDYSVDRVVANYVLDLLSADDAREFLSEARRVLTADGKLCLVSLTKGVSPTSRLVCAVWSRVFRWRPSLVGGCRPIRVGEYVDPDHWQTEYDNVISAFGVPSEVRVLSPVR